MAKYQVQTDTGVYEIEVDDNPIAQQSDAQAPTDPLAGSVINKKPADDVADPTDPIGSVLDFAAGPEYLLGKKGAAMAAERLGLPAVIAAPAKVASGLGLAEGIEGILGHARASRQPLNPVAVGINALGGQLASDAVTTPVDKAMTAEGSTLAEPSVQAGLRQAYRENPALTGGKSPEDISRITPGLEKTLQGHGNVALRGPVEAIGLQLGIDGDSTLFSKGLAEQWNQKGGAVINDPVLWKAQDVPQLARTARLRAQDVMAQKADLLQSMDDSGKLIRLPDVFSSDQFSELEGQISQLSQNGDTKPFAEAMQNKLDGLKRDLSMLSENPGNGLGLGVKPSDVNSVIENLNQYRREFLNEFSKANQAVVSRGDNALGLDEKVAVSAFSGAQDALSSALGSEFRDLNNKYGGYRALEDLAKNQAQATRQGLAVRPPTRIVQNAGQAATQSAFDPTRSVTSNALDKVGDAIDSATGAPNSAQQSFFQNATRDSRIMDNIRDVRAMQQNPNALTGAQAGPGLMARGLNAGVVKPGIAGVGSSLMSRFTDPGMASASGLPLQQDPYPAGLPRDTRTIKPQLFLPQFLEKTQGNPAAQQLALMFQKAMADGDRQKLESIHEGMVIAFPGVFEQGWGVAGKIRNRVEQKRYMGVLNDKYQQGQLPASFIASQQSSFNDPNDRNILALPQDFKPSMASADSSNITRILDGDGQPHYSY